MDYEPEKYIEKRKFKILLKNIKEICIEIRIRKLDRYNMPTLQKFCPQNFHKVSNGVNRQN